MNQPDELQYVNFGIYQKHLNLIKKVNEENKSQGLRTILDSIINGEEQTKRKKILDNSILYISLGFVLFSFIFLTENTYTYFIGLGLGLFLITYGGIGGVSFALRRTKRIH